MLSNRVLRQDFKDKISPHLEMLLQFSLWLTKNGRDATRLMRGAMAEAYRSWDEFTPEESYVRVHNILTNQFLSGNLRSNGSRTRLNIGSVVEDTASGDEHFIPGSMQPDQRSWMAGRSGANVSYLEAFAGLPSTLRSAMILSYLEGFSNAEISDLSGVEPRIVDTTLTRGREFMREQMYAHLMGDRPVQAIARQTVQTA